MCGIAGLIHRGKSADIGSELTAMLGALKHRGPDSTGFALYGTGQKKKDRFIMRFKVAEQDDLKGGFDIREQIAKRKAEVDRRLQDFGIKVDSRDQVTEYSYRYVFEETKELSRLIDLIEELDNVEILSVGHSLELVKDLGDANVVAGQYDLKGFTGTHAIGHTRMATESDVDIRSAHPYWAYPFSDVSVVHNGQLTNYWQNRRELERRGLRFISNCDSELIAVYLADRINRGDKLEDAMRRSVDELDGVFTYVVATADALGMAKDTMAAKPMVLFESKNFIALASEEVAIRSIFPEEIETSDPYDGEVRVWHI